MGKATVPSIGPRLQAERKKHRFSLDALAARSGVSKSMLSQIERGEANPTFATLWNLTRALEMDFSDLISGHSGRERTAIELLAASATPEIKAANGRCLLRILSPPTMAGLVEWYELVLSPGGALESRPHAKGAVEHLTVMDGTIRVVSGGVEQSLGKQATVRYPADVPHTIENTGRGVARAFLVVNTGAKTSPV